MKPALALCLLVLLLAAACSPKDEFGATLKVAETPAREATETPTVPPATRPGAEALEWERCHEVFECVTLEVPLDYTGAVPGTMDVPLVRLAADDDSERLGVLLVNPGGPGGSGVQLVVNNAEFWPEELHRFDIIGFDPRGVSGSTAVDCADDLSEFHHVDPSPDTPDERAELEETYEAFALACEERSGEYLPFIGGNHVVEDIEGIREALGEEQISFLGFSYGTYLGAKYADRYPERVRAFVLDGPTDPSLSGKDWQLQQALGFETAFDAFLADCGARRGCDFYSAGDPEGAYDSLMARIEEAPLRVGGRVVGPGEAEMAVISALYNKEYGWPRLADALAAAEEGDARPLLRMADASAGRTEDGSFEDFVEVYRAISCVDLDLPRDTAAFDAMAVELAAAAPRFGAALAYEHLDCAFWEAEAPEPAPVRAAGAPPILVVGVTRDPATPLVWAESLAGQLESGVLLTLEGDGHVAFGKSACIQRAVVKYLVDLELPADGTTCES